jgi:hypothetical protein
MEIKSYHPDLVAKNEVTGMSFIYLHFILIAKMSKAPFPGNLQHPY